jgi:hypothetical protein
MAEPSKSYQRRPRISPLRPPVNAATATAATRQAIEELGELEAAAESAGQVLSEWLRGTALSAARQRAADPAEPVLAEVWAVRYTLLTTSSPGIGRDGSCGLNPNVGKCA